MLKFEGIKIGSRIRAYDFEPIEDRPDRYIEGEIVRIMGLAYIVKCDVDPVAISRSNMGHHNRIGQEVFVPFEMDILDFDDRVYVV